jgi:hypothetical protein
MSLRPLVLSGRAAGLAGPTWIFTLEGVFLVSTANSFQPNVRRKMFLSTALFGMASLASIIGASTAWGADPKPIVNEKFADLAPAIAELRQEAGQDRRDIVKANMLLTQSESATFWPLYDEYRAARNKVGDRKVRLITDFAAARDSMSEEEAQRLTKEFLAIEKQKLAIKQSFVAKMSKLLSARTVARFFQIDQKLDATVDLALAAQIPLIH